VQKDVEKTITFFTDTATEVVRLSASVGLVVILVIVMLIYREELRDRFIRLTGSSKLTVTTKALDEAAKRISDYMLRKSIVNGILGAIITVVLALIGVPSAIIWGFLLAVLRFIPGVGVWLAAAPPVILSVVAIESWWPFLLVIFVFSVAELVAMNLVEPNFVGHQVGLLPVATMISLSFWTWLWGPVGLLLAIPLTVCLAVLGKYVPAMNFLHVLLSDQPAMNANLRYFQRLLAHDQDEATQIVDEYIDHHGREGAYDELLIPALGYARGHVLKHELTAHDQELFFRITKEILDDLELTFSTENLPSETGTGKELRLIGIPIEDKGDELALRMVDQLLNPHRRLFELASPGLLTSEVVEWVIARKPALICLAAIAPGKLAQTRFICKRLSAQLPGVTIIVARFGFPDDLAREREELQKIGVAAVCSTARDTIQVLLQHCQRLLVQQTPITATIG
jgi:hypothetical protein